MKTPKKKPATNKGTLSSASSKITPSDSKANKRFVDDDDDDDFDEPLEDLGGFDDFRDFDDDDDY